MREMQGRVGLGYALAVGMWLAVVGLLVVVADRPTAEGAGVIGGAGLLGGLAWGVRRVLVLQADLAEPAGVLEGAVDLVVHHGRRGTLSYTLTVAGRECGIGLDPTAPLPPYGRAILGGRSGLVYAVEAATPPKSRP